MKISTTGNTDRTQTSTAASIPTRARGLIALVLVSSLVAGCAAGRTAYNRGIEAELRENYDEALIHYENALNEKPGDIEYRLKVQQIRFAAAFDHFQNGRRALDQGDLEIARAEFVRAIQLDPTNQLAQSELARIDSLLASDAPAAAATILDFNTRKELARTDPSMDVRLSEIFDENIAQLVMTQNADAIYQTIADLVGLNVIFDSDWIPDVLTVDLADISVYDALDIVALQTRTFWEPINSNTIVVSIDNPTKRDTYETTMVKTIYMTNSVNPADLTEAITAIRTLLGLALIAQSTSMNAIMVRGTPDQIAIAEKIIDDFDKSRAEVLVEATVLEVDRNTLRELGILPPQGTSVGLIGQQTTDGDDGPVTTGNQVALSELRNLDGRSFSMTIPDTVANFLVADNNTRLVQNPSVRATDGVQAQIHIGSRVPVASGSFQPAFVGATGTPVVQFQYIDVGVNMDITPRVLLSREISLQVNVQVQATAGTNVISGVALPVFTNRSVNHTIRLNEGETNILGGLITNTESDQANGIPGLNRIPGLKYLFSSQTTSVDQTEIIVLLTPHIVRMPDLYDRNLQGLDIGPENDTRLRALPGGPVLPPLAPTVPSPSPAAPTTPAPAAPAANDDADDPAAALPAGNDTLSFAEAELNVEEGSSAEIVVHIDAGMVRGAEMTIEFDPQTVSLTDVRDGGFMSQGGANISIARNIDTTRGTAVVSVERSPQSPAVSGKGEVLRLVVQGVRPGASVLRIGDFRVHDGPTSQRMGQDAELTVHVQ